eukprot:TRINITY_DN21848_c0_g2_i2.p1 TRINITY_DN21848_c0_g2~~TRINITY_DN21848_c0_g2_i2.p1  ORF type:complete len:830 (+),score=150.38 TRINITY_DN21848_c0_g2_i2:76-2565(+)
MEQPAMEPEPEGKEAEEPDDCGNDEAEEETADQDMRTEMEAVEKVEAAPNDEDLYKEEASAETSLVKAAEGDEDAEPKLASCVPPARPGLWHLRSGALSKLRLRWARRKSGSETGAAADAGDLLVSDDDEPQRLVDAASSLEGELVGTGLDTSWQVVDRKGVVLAEETGAEIDPLARGSVEAKMERMLTWMLAPAIHGIEKLGVLSAEGRANELLLGHARDVEAAVREVVAGSERSVSALVLNFCLERIPVLGCPGVLLRTTWGNLRSILIIAALYGHDLESPRVQHEALLCLVPPGDEKDAAAASLKHDNADSGLSPGVLVGSTAQQVARMMIRGALRRATGLQAAVDCFELASLLYSSCADGAVDEDGFVHVMATPASAARDFFRKKSFASYALLWCSLPILVLGMASPGLWSMARLLPKLLEAVQSVAGRLPQGYLSSAPALLLFLTGPCFALRFLCVRLPAQRRRSSWLQSFLGQSNVGRWERFQTLTEEAWPKVVTSVVFLLHALLPAISTMSSLSVVVSALSVSTEESCWHGWDLLNRIASAALGLFSLSSVLANHVQASYPEASVRSLLLLRTASRLLCFLAAWAYLLLVVDSAIDRFARLWRTEARNSPLGIIGPMGWLLGAEDYSHPLENQKSVAFCLNLVSVISQQRLVELLARREVLLRLIGAERVTASTICLLFKGVAVACAPSKSVNPIAEFLMRVAPPPACCVAIVAVRSQAIVLGFAVVVAPKMTALLGSCPCFLLGLTAGAYAAHAVLSVWYDYRADLDSAALRLAMLVPGGVSNQAKGLLRGAIAGAHRRAVQMMAMGILQRALRWCAQKWQ